MRRWLLACALSGAALAAAPAVHADGPPAMEYLRVYGRVLADNSDLVPQAQPVIAIVGGQACGDAMTKRAEAPPEDAGKTVYVVQVLNDGPEAGERIGCGRPGDPVTFYFPVAGRLAQEQATWVDGGRRLDLTLTRILPYRAAVPALAADGLP